MGVSLSKSLKAVFILVLLGFAPVIYGQTTINDVKSSFNQAYQMEKINPEAAISSYETVIQLADEVGGDEAQEIKDQALGRIPRMYYELAKTRAGAKDYEGSIEMLDASIEGFNNIGDSRSSARSLSTVLSIRGVQGAAAMEAGNYDEAIGYYDDAIQRNPGYTKAYLGKLLVYDKMQDHDKMEEVALMGLQVCDQENDNRTAGDIKKVMSTEYFKLAQTDMASENYAGVEANLKKTIEYGNENAIVNYQLGLAQKNLKKWNDAVASFNKSIEMETGSGEDLAKIYFGLGECYQALGQNDQACAAYKNALYGEFKEAAQYQIDNVLECDK